jgi:malate dehydrogenase (oxaloacetate-decarboxylating)(NADP+)
VIATRIETLGLRCDRARLRGRQHRRRPALPRLLADLPPLTERKGVTEQFAKIEMRRRLTLVAAMLLHKGEVDGMICGTWGSTASTWQHIDQVIGRRAGVNTYACMNGLILPGRQVFLVDTHVNYDPTAEQLAEITVLAAEEMRASASARRRRCCRTAISAPATSRRR